MTNGSISSLNGHLFDALERLSDGKLSGQALADEVQRAMAVVGVADRITESHKTAILAAKVYAEHGAKVANMLPQIGGQAPAKQIDGKGK